MEELKLAIKKMNTKGDKESVLQFLSQAMKLIPPSDDYGVTLVKKGVHEYVLDRKGVVIVSLSQDEYLPFFSAEQKRIDTDKIPDDVIKEIKLKWKEILDQLRDYALDYSKFDKKYLKIADDINGVLFENL